MKEATGMGNAPLQARLVDLARGLYGSDRMRTLDAVNRAVVDLLRAVVCRDAHRRRLPSWLEADVAIGVRALLKSHPADTDHRGS